MHRNARASVRIHAVLTPPLLTFRSHETVRMTKEFNRLIKSYCLEIKRNAKFFTQLKLKTEFLKSIKLTAKTNINKKMFTEINLYYQWKSSWYQSF